jgi:hypothetical protein
MTMLAHELCEGDEYREKGKLIYTVILDATEFEDVVHGPSVYVQIRYAQDGGISDRAFSRDQPVKHIRPE